MGRRRKRRRFRLRQRRLNLRRTLFLLPNLVTLSSIFCGFYAMVLAATGRGDDDFFRAALLIVFAMFFDMLDGRVARATKTQSAFGLQLDSLADVVSFGAAPALLIYSWTLSRLGVWGMFAAFAYVACGAIRLARFNVLSMDASGAPTTPPKYIVGLPIPGAAGILVALVVANRAVEGALGGPQYVHLILAVMLGLAWLMVSSVRFRSFKDLKLNLRTVLFVALAIGSSAVVSTQLEPAFVLLWLLGAYVALGIVEWLLALPRRLRSVATRHDSTAPPPEPE
ncbi:MAG: CDP-diacylglycerol--serine O-phosphatidyltransferase [Deltaproteobacteria bacterium]|jgi:CDP-diacylglycerol--serine O-phosphatidyltransferase|nr:CDP-diacylglycerol--serine O-phosphatidyltransferase [Deltaproteobacteria bacterium]MBW2532872.1 CDP-diacylglycerol--serine O-phosphatidyltransferase [Deltaproteobacteria bacterium]